MTSSGAANAKLKCCAFPIVLAREDAALKDVVQPLEQATDAGDEAIDTPCPLRHLSLDAWRTKANETAGRAFDIPTLHTSQLIGLAAGLPESVLKFQRYAVPVGEMIMNAVLR